MANSGDDLFTMRGHVAQVRPAPPSLIDRWINQRIREALDRRTVWADLITRTTLSFPNQYDTGTISLTTGSNVVTGSGTNWPMNDVVNITIPKQLNETGYQTIIVGIAGMANIKSGKYLYLDPTGPNPEAIPVYSTQTDRFNTYLNYTHAAGALLYGSSLNGQQLNPQTNDPIFTVLAITSPTTALIDIPWGNASITGQAYIMLQMYITVDPNFRDFLTLKDTIQGIPIEFHKSRKQVDWADPQRTNTGGPPFGFVDLSPDFAGNIQFEVWPAINTAYQLDCLYVRQWPNMARDTDVPPWFINPNVFITGALADAHRFKSSPQDPFFNLQLADVYERKFDQLLNIAEKADDGKLLSSYTDEELSNFGTLGANWMQSHDWDSVNWNM